MKIILGKIGGKERVDIETKLQNASEAVVATCYFRPSSKVMECLKRIPKLRLIYSREYKVTAPDLLKELVSTGAKVRYVATDDPHGRMHAKVYYIVREDGRRSCFIGSANFTYDGLFRNQEAGVLFDSRDRNDAVRIKKISGWLTSLWQECEGNTFDESEYKYAKRQYEARNLPLRSSEIHPWKRNTLSEWGKTWRTIRYWALKTTDDSTGEDHWQRFLKEKVIAIGWDFSSGRAKKFREFNTGDIVLICAGYRPNTGDKTPIFMKGVARVIGEAHQDKDSDWWAEGGKRKANIQVIDKTLEKENIVDSLKKESLALAVHEITKPDYFESLAIKLYDEYGTIIDV